MHHLEVGYKAYS